MGKNKIITSQGNVQFITSKGRTTSVHPWHVYAVYEGDTVSFLFIYMKDYSGQAFFASQYEDLELNGVSYDNMEDLKNAINTAFAHAGAQARAEIVDELPEDPYTNTIYLVKKEHGEGYDEYIWNEEKSEWELIGDTDIEFERYLKIDDFNPYSAATKDYIDAVSANTVQNASDIQFLSGAVDTEIAAREAADTALSGAVDTVAADLVTESQRAISAETQLQNNINTVNGRVDAEQIARAQADTALSGAIDTVVSNLANEVSARTAADEALDSKIDTVSGDVISETSRAEGAEIALGGRIDNEITARTSADTALQTAINNEASARTDADSALSGAIDSVDSKVDTLSGEVQTMGDEAIVDAAYVSSSTTIDFYNASGNVVAQVDATDFIKDGMIEDVRIENGYLIIDFNTESGIQDIEIPLMDIFNPDNYYDKTAVDGLLAGKADLSALTEDERVWGEALNDLNSRVDTFSASVETELSSKANSADVYTKSEVYTKAEVDEAIAEIDLSDYYTTAQTDSKLALKADLSALTEDERVLGEALNDLNSRVDTISGDVASKFDASGITAYSTSQEVTAEIDAAVSGKQDTLIAGENITISGNVISSTGGGDIDSGAVETMIEDYMTDDSMSFENAYTVRLRTGDKSIDNRFSMSVPEIMIYQEFTLNPHRQNGYSGNTFDVDFRSSGTSAFMDSVNIPSGAEKNNVRLAIMVKTEYANYIPNEYKGGTRTWIGLDNYITEPTRITDLIPTWNEDYEYDNKKTFDEVSGNTFALLLQDYSTSTTNWDYDLRNKFITLDGKERNPGQYKEYVGQYVVIWNFEERDEFDPMSRTNYTVLSPITTKSTYEQRYDGTWYADFNADILYSKTYEVSDLSNLTNSVNGLLTSATTESVRLDKAVFYTTGNKQWKVLSKINGINLYGDQINITHKIASVNGQDIFISGSSSSYSPVDIDVRGDWSVSDSTSKNYIKNKPTITSAVTENSTAVVESGGVYRQMGGLSLVKLTQAEYDALATKDLNTLYIISD